MRITSKNSLLFEQEVLVPLITKIPRKEKSDFVHRSLDVYEELKKIPAKYSEEDTLFSEKEYHFLNIYTLGPDLMTISDYGHYTESDDFLDSTQYDSLRTKNVDYIEISDNIRKKLFYSLNTLKQKEEIDEFF